MPPRTSFRFNTLAASTCCRLKARSCLREVRGAQASGPDLFDVGAHGVVGLQIAARSSPRS